MGNLLEAYKLLDEIKDSDDSKLIEEKATEAFNLSSECIEAAIILSKLKDNFSCKENVLELCLNKTNSDEVKYELANLYYEYGLFKKSLDLYLLNENYKLSKYRIMTLFALFEDERIEEFYKKYLNNDDSIDFVRLSFTYMLYKYKKHELDSVNELFKEIKNINPSIIDVFLSTVKKEDENTKEAYKVFKNNSIILNSSPLVIKYLESLC